MKGDIPVPWLEAVAILGMIFLAAFCVFFLKELGKDVALQTTSALGGYIGGRGVGMMLASRSNGGTTTTTSKPDKTVTTTAP
jgi:hypothetical protein